MKIQFSVVLLCPLMAIANSSNVQAPSEEQQAPQDLLIQKLNHVNMTLPNNDPAKIGVTLRLADLLGERARKAAMKDLEDGCTVCEAGKSDREKALRLYTEVLPKASPEQKSKILIQTGHLNQLLGNEKTAISAYENVLKDTSISGTIKAEANLALAEIFYKKNKFQVSREYYQKVLEEKTASSRGLAAYRIAWCDFNSGKFNDAVTGIKNILKTPELQSRSGGAATTQADQGFLEEVSRDLATFMSRKPLVTEELNEVYELSPASTRLANVVLMANEYERTGKKSDATLVWTFAYERMSSPALKVEALVHLAPLQFKESDTAASLKMLEDATALWSELKGCGVTDCSELQKILRQFIVNWNQTEKKAPSENLQKAYGAYLKIFPQETQMQLWAAMLAQTRKDWTAAAGFYQGAIASLDQSTQAADLETPLLAFVEMAEMSKDEALWQQATDLYLNKSPKKTKSFEISYQKAQKIYDKGDNEQAAAALKNLALVKEAPVQLRTQAAHLSLDALGLLKDDVRLISWSQEYAKALPTSAKEFKEVAQKAVLTQTAKLAEADQEAAWATLSKFESQEASTEDQKIYLKNKIVLAEKTKRFSAAAQAVDEYLLIKNLSAEDKEFALGRKTWLAELRLDFSTALKTFEKMAAPQLKPDQKMLKMAIYADLAGLNSNSYYQNFIASSKDQDIKTDIAAQLVRKSATPEKELAKNLATLNTKPELLGRLYAEIYVKNPQPGTLKLALANKSIEPTVWGKSLWRVSFIEQLRPLQQKISSQALDSSTQKALTRTIKTRAADIENLEKLAAQAIQKADWTAQVVSLSWLAKENQRFYEELLSLPIPAGLTPDEESQYMTLLGQQAAPYKNRADEANVKLTEFWQSPWKEALSKSVTEAGEFRLLIEQEIKTLQAVAAPEQQLALSQILEVKEVIAAPDVKLVEAARNEVRESPLDKNRLEKLLAIEKQAKNFAMVQYLEGRLRQIEEKGTL